jgi:putative addiction module CopG family antidote
MDVTIPESLEEFVQGQVSSGRYKDVDAFVADLLRAEEDMAGRIARGEPLPMDEHLPRRFEALLDEAAGSGEYLEVTSDDFDAMEREAQALFTKRRPQ